MIEQALSMDTLSELVLDQLREHGYKESSLVNYSRIFKRIERYCNETGDGKYTPDAGNRFLEHTNVSDHTLTAYGCVVRRLDDYLSGRPYRSHRDEPHKTVPPAFAGLLNDFLGECRKTGNKQRTLQAKEKTATEFLLYIDQEGCTRIADIDVTLVSRALLIINNKDNYGRIRQFLEYLYNVGLTKTNFSGIVPHYKKPMPLPTSYEPSEIQLMEDSIDITTDTGKRNIAIMRLATRMGLRAGDIARLRWSEIDLDSGILSISQEKTGDALSLQMPDDVSGALKQHLENHRHECFNDDFVFHALVAPHERITTSIIRHIFVESLSKGCIDTVGKKRGPHAFRSSLATSMVNNGVSYETVRRILGHADPNVIKHYAKTDIEELRSCAIDPPDPTGHFSDFLSGKEVLHRV